MSDVGSTRFARHSVAGDHRRRRQLRRRIADAVARVAFALLLIAATPLGAVVTTTITIDGQFEDWAGVLADAGNVVADTSGDAGDLDHDLSQAAATGDANYLYLHFRRASSSGGKAWRTTAYIDCDGNGLLENTDRIVWFRFLGNGSYTGGGVYRYVPAVAGGDPLDGDGALPPGTQGAAVVGASYTAERDIEKILIEGRVNWAALGVGSDAPVSVQFALGPQNGTPLDTSDVVSLRRRSVTLVKPEATAGTADTTVTIAHTVTNTGNGTDNFTLAATSLLWPVTIRDASQPVGGIQLGAGQSATIYLDVRVAAGALDGERDTITLTAASVADPGVSASVVDKVSVGQLLVIPDGTGSMAAGSIIRYRAMVTNNSTIPRSAIASAASGAGWTANLYEADGVTPLGGMSIGPNSGYPIVIDVSVPATATIGMQDLTVVRAAVASDTAIHGDGTYTTVVRPAIEMQPDADQYAGPNTYSYFRQVIRNSWPTTRTISLSGISASGWQVAYYADDGVTPITSITLGPNGATGAVKMRVRVPATATVGYVDTITSTAAQGAQADTCISRVTVVRLATYDSAGFANAADTFLLGSTVHARVMGFPSGQTAIFRWIDPSGAVSTDTRTIDALGAANSLYALGAAASVGTWTVEATVGGTLVGPIPFYVRYDAGLTALTASDADPAGTPISITSTAQNRSGGTIPASAVRYRVWWDANGDDSFGAGDTWLDALGDGHPWTPPGDQYTRETTLLALPGVTAWTDPGWSLSSDALPYSGTWRVTAEWLVGPGIVIDERETTFLARLSTLSLTVGTSAYSFGVVDPGQTYDSGPIPIFVSASEAYDLTKSTTGMVSEMGLTSDLVDQFNQAAGPATFVDRFLVNIPWTTDPGPVNATVTYTIVAR